MNNDFMLTYTLFIFDYTLYEPIFKYRLSIKAGLLNSKTDFCFENSLYFDKAVVLSQVFLCDRPIT